MLPFEVKKREILIKHPVKTSDKYGKKPEDRTVAEILDYGVVNIDKPSGPTSHQVSAYVQKILNVGKAGHSGTLDPKVTGVLPIAIGRGTRVVSALLKAGKEYVCIMHVHKETSEEQIRKVFDEFTGSIRQLPPVKSAVKRQMRTRSVYYIEILEIKEQDVLFKVGCEAGTYIRKLVHDVGLKLGTGAHMTELRRTKAGPFSESTSMITLHDLTDAYYYYKQGNEEKIRKCIRPVEFAVTHLPKIWVMDSAVESLCHGVSLKVPGISKLDSGIEPEMLAAVMSLKDELICLGIARMASKKVMESDKGLAFSPNQVFMQSGAYPKMEK